MSTFAIIPVKNLKEAKTRLSSILNDKERQVFVLTMLQDVLNCITKSNEIRDIIIVTSDKTIAKYVNNYNVKFLIETLKNGLNSAIKEGINFCMKMEAKSMLIIPADIPLILIEDIHEIIALGKEAALVISPSRDEKGTNALLIKTSSMIDLHYGPNSFQLHLNEALSKGIFPKIYKSSRIAFDIDTPKDLADFISLKSDTKSYEILMKMNIEKRLKNFNSF